MADPLVVATRIHGSTTLTDDPALSQLSNFLAAASQYASHIVIATEYDTTSHQLFDAVTNLVKRHQQHSKTDHAVQHGERPLSDDEATSVVSSFVGTTTQYHVLPVLNWKDSFTPALNALLQESSRLTGCSGHILYQSIEVVTTPEAVATLSQHMESSNGAALVCGAALEGHVFSTTSTSSFVGQSQTAVAAEVAAEVVAAAKVAAGTTCPWNTFAMWSIPLLLRTGFLPISDGRVQNTPGGVEEVACVAVQQKLFPNTSRSSLLRLDENQISWLTSFRGEGRKQWHERKMRSKIERSTAQLLALGLDNDDVCIFHVDARNHHAHAPQPETSAILEPPKYFNPLIKKTKHVRMVEVGQKGIKKEEKEEGKKVIRWASFDSYHAASVDTKTDESKEHGNNTIISSISSNCQSPSAGSQDAGARSSSTGSSTGSGSGITFRYVQACPSFQFATVLVTGGAGFIGSHCVERLLSRGNQVVIIDDFNDYYDVKQKQANITHLRALPTASTHLHVISGDIRDKNLLTNIFEDHQPTLVIHLAARAGVRPSLENPHIYVETNVGGTTNLMELARLNGVEHFVYASSSSVYGGSMKNKFSEMDIVDHPVSPYAATKKACELMASTYHHLYQLNCAGLRFFTVYGPRGRPDMAPDMFLRRAATGAVINQYGDGTSERDYTYVGDIVDGVLRCLDRPAGNQVYNLGNGRPISLKKFIGLVGQTVCPAKGLNMNYMDNQPGDVPRTCADITKAKKMLGYAPSTKFEEGLQNTYEWMKKQLAEKEH